LAREQGVARLILVGERAAAERQREDNGARDENREED
jgi:hypothetical protein